MVVRMMDIDIEKLRTKAASGQLRKNGSLTDPVRKARNKLAVLKRDGFQCTRCGAKEHLTVDHVVRPKTWQRIGHRRNDASSYAPRLCITLCVECHTEKNGGDAWAKRIV